MQAKRSLPIKLNVDGPNIIQKRLEAIALQQPPNLSNMNLNNTNSIIKLKINKLKSVS